MKESRVKRLGNVELLRAIAASWVVLTHASGWASAQGVSHPGSALFSVGFVGVDVFFAISGFVITLNYLSRPVGFVKFMWARILRIVPLYWTVTLMTTAVAIAFLSTGANTDAFSSMSPSWVMASLTFLSQSLLGNSPVIYQGWTLELEMAFYLLFGVALFLSKGRHVILFSVLGVALVFASGLSLLPSIVFEFCFGILVALAHSKLNLSFSQSTIIGLVSFGLGAIGLYIGLSQGFEEELRFISLGIPSALILLAAVLFPQVSASWIYSVGSASYAIYLWQVLTIPITGRLVFGTIGGELPWLLIVLPLGVTIALGIVSDRFYDQPLRTWLQKVTTSSKVPKRETGG